MSTVGREKLAQELIDDVDEAGALLKAMANEKRLVILCHLLQGEKSVGEMEELLDKLKLLHYETTFCRQMGFKAFSR